MPRLSNKVVSTKKGKRQKYSEGELVILLVYRREGSKETFACMSPGSKNTRP